MASLSVSVSVSVSAGLNLSTFRASLPLSSPSFALSAVCNSSSSYNPSRRLTLFHLSSGKRIYQTSFISTLLSLNKTVKVKNPFTKNQNFYIFVEFNGLCIVFVLQHQNFNLKCMKFVMNACKWDWEITTDTEFETFVYSFSLALFSY